MAPILWGAVDDGAASRMADVAPGDEAGERRDVFVPALSATGGHALRTQAVARRAADALDRSRPAVFADANRTGVSRLLAAQASVFGCRRASDTIEPGRGVAQPG